MENDTLAQVQPSQPAKRQRKSDYEEMRDLTEQYIRKVRKTLEAERCNHAGVLQNSLQRYFSSEEFTRNHSDAVSRSSVLAFIMHAAEVAVSQRPIPPEPPQPPQSVVVEAPKKIEPTSQTIGVQTEAALQTVKEKPKETIPKSPKEPLQELPKELPKDPVKDLPKDPVKDLPKYPAKDLPKDPAKDLPKDPAKDLPRDLPKDPAKDLPKDSAKDPPKDSAKDLPKDPVKDLSKESPVQQLADRTTFDSAPKMRTIFTTVVGRKDSLKDNPPKPRKVSKTVALPPAKLPVRPQPPLAPVAPPPNEYYAPIPERICEICRSRFWTDSDLQNHYFQQHMPENPNPEVNTYETANMVTVMCPIDGCKEQFEDDFELLRHMRNFHES